MSPVSASDARCSRHCAKSNRDHSIGSADTTQIDATRCGYIDTSGKFVINPQFYYAGDIKDGLAKVIESNLTTASYIDRTGKVVWKGGEPTVTIESYRQLFSCLTPLLRQFGIGTVAFYGFVFSNYLIFFTMGFGWFSGCLLHILEGFNQPFGFYPFG